jgi:LCP family protein required for cell wall assembly
LANKKNNSKKGQDGKMLSKFLKVFILVFAILILIVGAATAGYAFLINRDDDALDNQESGLEGSDLQNSGDASTGDDSASKNEQKMITFAVFGVDEDGWRTDVTMLVFFDTEDLSIDILSVPRDTQVKIPDDIYEEILTRRTDVDQMVKINGVPAYTLASERNQTSVAVLEYAFGIDIDYYISLDLDGFVEIVDLIAPITMNVPIDMVYDDPEADFHINLSAGEQEIWGQQAEMLIRYRKGNDGTGYANGDLGRIETQKLFMIAFMDELLQIENKLNIVNIASTASLYIDTDFTQAIDYIHYINDISTDNISFSTIPGTSSYYNGVSYYIYDYDATKVVLNNIINATEDEQDIEELEPHEEIEPELILETKLLPISVQNGTHTSGFAAKVDETLTTAGYNVVEATNYENKPVERTMLFVPTEDVGNELAAYFNDPEIIIDESLLDEETQIIIVLGGTDDE